MLAGSVVMYRLIGRRRSAITNGPRYCLRPSGVSSSMGVDCHWRPDLAVEIEYDSEA